MDPLKEWFLRFKSGFRPNFSLQGIIAAPCSKDINNHIITMVANSLVTADAHRCITDISSHVITTVAGQPTVFVLLVTLPRDINLEELTFGTETAACCRITPLTATEIVEGSFTSFSRCLVRFISTRHFFIVLFKIL